MTVQWVGGPPRIAEELDELLEKELFLVAADVHRGVVARTPVRSGELRASWNLTADSPDFSTVGSPYRSPRKPGPPLPAPITPSFIKSDTGVYYVVNGKVYAGLVEDGGPTNRAYKMLDRTLDVLDI